MPGLGLALLLLTACATAAPEPVAVQMQVLVYNIHAGKDASGAWNLDRVAEVVKARHVDIALLQEVDRRTERSGGEDQPARLEELTGHTAVFGRTLDYQGGEYGIAVLTRFSVAGHATRSMSVEPPQERAGGSDEPRGMLVTTVHSPAGLLHVVNTHLDAGRDDHYRRQEVSQLVAAADSLRAAGASVVLGGDLNAEPDSEVISRLHEAGWRDAWMECGSGAGLTFPSTDPIKRIDYLFISRDLRCLTAEVLETQASDHRALLVTLESTGGGEP